MLQPPPPWWGKHRPSRVSPWARHCSRYHLLGLNPQAAETGTGIPGVHTLHHRPRVRRDEARRNAKLGSAAYHADIDCRSYSSLNVLQIDLGSALDSRSRSDRHTRRQGRCADRNRKIRRSTSRLHLTVFTPAIISSCVHRRLGRLLLPRLGAGAIGRPFSGPLGALPASSHVADA